jgi:Uncharacterized protein, 4-oxalocrotonate tautomerase homolog
MPFIRITTLQGLLSPAEKQSIAEGLTLAIMKIETGGLDTPQFRAISALAFEEIASGSWFVGGQPADGDAAALVEIRVPEGAVDDARREAMAKAVEDVLSANSEAFRKAHGQRILWTHILEIKDGNWGARGRIVKLDEIKRIAGGAPSAI